MTDSLHALSGAYVVDALDDAERAAFERHLAQCPDCQQEVASLREATALMADDAAIPLPRACATPCWPASRTSVPSRPRPTATPPRPARRRRRPCSGAADAPPTSPHRRPGRGRGSHPGHRRRRGAPALAGRPRPQPDQCRRPGARRRGRQARLDRLRRRLQGHRLPLPRARGERCWSPTTWPRPRRGRPSSSGSRTTPGR